jgi:glycosyltransferase involved in cell wall biosynthesis
MRNESAAQASDLDTSPAPEHERGGSRVKKAAVLTFINTVSGQYRWWDEFPAMIGDALRRASVEHICFRRDYDAFSTEPPGARHPTPEGALGDMRWLRENVRPLATPFEKVIFHTHGHYQPVWLGNEVLHHGGARWFWTEHRISTAQRFDGLRKAARTMAQGVGLLPHRLYGVSHAGAARLRQQFRSTSVRCIRTGIRLLPQAQRTPPRGALTPRRALFVGRLIPEKGLWPLLHAFRVLKERNVDATLTLVGGGPLEHIEQLERFIEDGKLRDRINVAGFQRDICRFYREADFLIIPTLVPEALGMVSLEARMHALPVIYSRRGGLPETQIDGITGLGLAQVTPEEIADTVVRLQSDPAGYAEMSRRAPAGLEEFSIEAMVDAYVRDYLEELASL